ncbi:MAG: hypothetical protein EA392_07325 [Cryomorphaceae bacterium]|nr:MAG: hypothetical protein EA392_07325 [Cryomorphaceae bacterium]
MKLPFDSLGLGSYTPSGVVLKGISGQRGEKYVLFVQILSEFLVFNAEKAEIEEVFSFPNDDHVKPRLLEVVSLDSIIVFKEETQTLLVANRESVVHSVSLALSTVHDPPHLIFLPVWARMVELDGYLGLSTWIQYGEGGPEVDYDALMDERNMAAFFKVQGDTVLRRDILIKPILRRTTIRDSMLIDKPFFEVDSKRRKVLVHHVSSDTVMTFNWDDEQVEKHVVTGSDVVLTPAKVPKREPAHVTPATYESQERGYHRIFFEEASGFYVRELVKMFPVNALTGSPERSDIRKVQVLNSDFEVVAEMDLPEEIKFSGRIGASVFLHEANNEQRVWTLYKFGFKNVLE